MSKKLAEFFHKIATDAAFRQKFNAGHSRTDLAKHREALMQQEGLSEDDKNVVRGHDNDAVDNALRQELSVQLDSWSNTSNSTIKVSQVSS